MDDAEIETLTEKPEPLTKRNWILLSVDDELDKIVSKYPSSSHDKLKSVLQELPQKSTNIGSKFDGINSLNDYIVDYYRRRFGGDLTTRPMSSPTDNSPHSFRRFSSTSIDQLTLKSKFQALQWKFRHQPPLTVYTGAHPPPPPSSVAATSSSASPSFRRKAGRLVDESFGFIDSELKKPRKKFVSNSSSRNLHRTEFEIQLAGSGNREKNKKMTTTNFQTKLNKNQRIQSNNHLVEYSSNGDEVYAVYAKRNQSPAVNDVLANQRSRNVQFDDQIRVVERYHPDMQISTGGFVRQLCAIVKPHKRDKEYFSSKLNVISAYSPSINVPKPNSPSGDLESSFYSAAKSCTLPSVPTDGPRSPDMLTPSNNENCRDIYSADVDQASITENPAFRDEFNFSSPAPSGSRQLGSQMQTKNDEIFITHESDIGRSKRQTSTSPYEPLKSKSFIVAICTVVILIIMTAIGVGFTIYYD